MNKEGIQNVAHIRRSDRKEQPLEEHLRGTAKLAEMFTSEIGLEETGELMGLLHDFGKASERFATYIRSESGIFEEDMPEYKKYTRGEIDHSTAGAKFLEEKYNSNCREIVETLSLQMIELCILSHHSGLINCLDGDRDRLNERLLKTTEETAFEEAKQRIDIDLIEDVDRCANTGIKSLSELLNSIQSDLNSYLRDDDPNSRRLGKSKLHLRIGLLERYLLSCLIDADHIDSNSFELRDDNTIDTAEHSTWGTLQERCELFISKLDSDTPVDAIRKNVSNRCFVAASRQKGTYLLSVPTGGGKTLSSLRFALKHAKEHDMKRIFFIIPYTTIIDQNAKVIRDVLEMGYPQEEIVLEHHSSLDPLGNDASEDSQLGHWRLSSENWDAPIILTTMVQFMNSIFSSGAKNVKRMHNLANSIIIFDEIQTIPTKVVYLFNETVNFLSKYCRSTIVLCTATQPLLNSSHLKHPIMYLDESPELVGPAVDSLYEQLKRTEITLETPKCAVDLSYVSSLAITKIKEYESVLIIVNTKKSAKQIHDLIEKENPNDVGLFHLSTNMCPAHRMKVLESLKDNLREKKKSICVSTQLIEAGVDIDFNVVIRSIAGIDSIAQAAGRCNRNGKMRDGGKVFLVDLDENIDKLTDIYYGKDNAKKIIHRYSENINDILTPAVMREFYEGYFFDREGAMSYKCRSGSDSLFSLLSSNENALMNYFHSKKSMPKTKMLQSFKDANDEFRVIEAGTVAIIVPYDEKAERIIADLCSDRPSEYPRRLLRQAQKYTINVFKKTFDDLLKDKAVTEITNNNGLNGIYFLKEGNYDKKCGLSEQSETKFLKM